MGFPRFFSLQVNRKHIPLSKNLVGFSILFYSSILFSSLFVGHFFSIVISVIFLYFITVRTFFGVCGRLCLGMSPCVLYTILGHLSDHTFLDEGLGVLA